MFGIDSSELAIIALVALLVIGPKDLPRVMRQVGQWLAKGRAMTRHVRSGFDTMMREAELEEMQKAWAAQNEAIMKATALPELGIRNPMPDLGAAMGSDDWMLPPPPLAPEIVDIAPAETPAAAGAAAAEPAAKRRRKPTVADADTPPAPRRRAAKKPATAPAIEPQASEP
ncbi:Sec-independent protein translocase protein TatB [Sandarakinorhabdus sp. DWP1-3-1]|uniref:Sec-independent protein translocase protein TatB n=1 Tax=Sandarakinorhabdus sp. DWP1-3-1 TaxID=2804627 RepID=UPI003CF86F86